MYIYYIIFFSISLFAILEPNKKKEEKWVFIFMLIFLSLFAGFRSEKSSTDYSVYIEMFRFIKPEIIFFDREFLIEPFFIFISSLLKYLNISVLYTFLIFALLGVFIKGKVIRRDSNFWFFSLLIYYSNFFLLHEMTQIRAGVAIGVFLYAIPFIVEKKILPYFISIMIAMCFHYSAVLFLPLYFLSNKTFSKFLFLSILLISIFVGFLKLPFMEYLKFIPLDIIQKKQDLYSGSMENGKFSDSINLFNVFSLIDLVMCSLLIFKKDTLEKQIPFFNIYAKIYIIGVCCFFCLSSFPPIAFRIKELFLGGQFIVFTFTILAFPKHKILSKLIIIAICFLFLYINIFHNHIVKEYV